MPITVLAYEATTGDILDQIPWMNDNNSGFGNVTEDTIANGGNPYVAAYPLTVTLNQHGTHAAWSAGDLISARKTASSKSLRTYGMKHGDDITWVAPYEGHVVGINIERGFDEASMSDDDAFEQGFIGEDYIKGDSTNPLTGAKDAMIRRHAGYNNEVIAAYRREYPNARQIMLWSSERYSRTTPYAHNDDPSSGSNVGDIPNLALYLNEDVEGSAGDDKGWGWAESVTPEIATRRRSAEGHWGAFIHPVFSPGNSRPARTGYANGVTAMMTDQEYERLIDLCIANGVTHLIQWTQFTTTPATFTPDWDNAPPSGNNIYPPPSGPLSVKTNPATGATWTQQEITDHYAQVMRDRVRDTVAGTVQTISSSSTIVGNQVTTIHQGSAADAAPTVPTTITLTTNEVNTFTVAFSADDGTDAGDIVTLWDSGAAGNPTTLAYFSVVTDQAGQLELASGDENAQEDFSYIPIGANTKLELSATGSSLKRATPSGGSPATGLNDIDAAGDMVAITRIRFVNTNSTAGTARVQLGK